MKVAIIHDDLLRRGGAENVVRAISDIYPDAPIYTLAYQPDATYPEFKEKKIITSWYQIIARNETLMKWLFFPFGILAMRSLKVSGYDLVILSTTYCAKYAKVDKRSIVFSYCYTPFRLAWNPSSYSIYKNSRFPLRQLFNFVIWLLRGIDFRFAKRANYYIAMTRETRDRILDAYNPSKPLKIISPAVNLSNFKVRHEIGDYYLVVSRMEPYKKVDLVINAFNKSGKKLIIVGNGSQIKSLKEMANSNIEFKSGLSYDELSELYARSKAFIFPQHEDFGITPLESIASGRPVIAYRKGGVLDTMVPFGDEVDENWTAVMFNKQRVEDLNNAILRFEELSCKPEFLRRHAEKFSEDRFKKEIKEYIDSIL